MSDCFRDIGAQSFAHTRDPLKGILTAIYAITGSSMIYRHVVPANINKLLRQNTVE